MLHKNSRISLSVMDETDDKQLCLLGRALSTPERLQILRKSVPQSEVFR